MNGEAFLLYTTESGGRWRVVKETEENKYEDVLSRRSVVEDAFTRPDVHTPIYVVVLARAEENFDFVLGHSRDTYLHQVVARSGRMHTVPSEVADLIDSANRRLVKA